MDRKAAGLRPWHGFFWRSGNVRPGVLFQGDGGGSGLDGVFFTVNHQGIRVVACDVNGVFAVKNDVGGSRPEMKIF